MTKPLVLKPQIPSFQGQWLLPKFWPVWFGFGLIRLLTFVPLRFRQGLARSVGRLAYRLNHKRRHVVNVNLSKAFSTKTEEEVEEMAISHFVAMARSFLDMGFLWYSSDKKLLQQIDVRGQEHLFQARNSGQQVIYHVAHVAGLEFGAAGVGSLEPAVGLYQAFKNPLLNWQIARARHRFGNRVFQRKDGFRSYVRSLRAGKALYSLTDEDFGQEQSVAAGFFDQQKSTLVTTARLAALTEAVVIPLVTRYDWELGQYVVELGEPVKGLSGKEEDAQADAVLLNRSLEVLLVQKVEEYMWTLKIYRSVLPPGSYDSD